MEYMTSKTAQTNFGALLDSAQHHPIVIKRHKRDCVVVMSMAEFEEYRKARAKALMDFCDAASIEAANNGMTEDVLNNLLQP
jgi:PHD/YefM family antitoxin component YafN of YafNO toxin-antitoxin module